MDLALTADERDFQDEVRDFIAGALTPELQAAGRLMTSAFCDPEFNLPWHRKLHARGWAAPSWPAEYGGPGWSEMKKAIFAAECARAGAPSLAPNGLRMVGPCIIGCGTPEQKAHYLPKILSGEDYWCQGYSEPGSGSDLASLQMRADSDGDHYVLNGSKIWTTHAQYANRMFCLVRTRFEGRPQAGITFLLLDMALPGITVKPIITLAGDHEVNQVFFDDVRVPKSGRVGEENAGWTVAKYLLEFERGGSWAPGLKVALGRVRDMAADEASDSGGRLIADPAFRASLAAAEIAIEALQMTEHRVLADLAGGRNPGPASSMLKAKGTEAMQAVDELTLEVAARYAWADQPLARRPGANAPVIGPRHSLTAMPRYLNNRAGSIYGGSNEIQRNIMARQMLGL